VALVSTDLIHKFLSTMGYKWRMWYHGRRKGKQGTLPPWILKIKKKRLFS